MAVGMSFPAWMTAVVSRPIGLGKVFYVHGFDGDDGNNGVDPSTPFKTITYALSQCVSGRNDYIIVLNGWSETTPIVVNKTRVHIIGMGCDGMPLVSLTSSQDSEIFQISGDAGDFCEIAGFDLGGGDNHAGIEPAAGGPTADLVYIHHCNFGSEYCGDTPQNGVWLPAGAGAKAWKIEKCKFMGTDGDTGGKLTASGVRIDEGAQHEVVDCLFSGCVAPSITIMGQAHVVRNNDIAMPADALGGGITIAVGSANCVVIGNRAAFGETAGALAKPYLDNCGANANIWTANYWHSTYTDP